jgi:hypothetical protein
LALAAAAAAVGLFIVLRDGGEAGTEPATTPTTAAEGQSGSRGAPAIPTTIGVEGGQPVGGVRELEASKGERVRFTVESDMTEEVHVHGYDLSKEVAAGGSVSFDFRATLEGVFEVELESSHTQIAELRVQPR